MTSWWSLLYQIIGALCATFILTMFDQAWWIMFFCWFAALAGDADRGAWFILSERVHFFAFAPAYALVCMAGYLLGDLSSAWCLPLAAVVLGVLLDIWMIIAGGDNIVNDLIDSMIKPV